MIRAALVALLISQTASPVDPQARRKSQCIDQELDEWRLGERDAGRFVIEVDHAFITTPDGGVTLATSGVWLSDDQLFDTSKELADRRARDTAWEAHAGDHVYSLWTPVLIFVAGAALGGTAVYVLTKR